MNQPRKESIYENLKRASNEDAATDSFSRSNDTTYTGDLTAQAPLKESERTATKLGRRSQFFDNKASEGSTSCHTKRRSKYPVPKRGGVMLDQTLEMASPEWLSTKAAARYLCTTEGALINRVYRGQLTRYKLGRSLRFKKSELDRLLEASRKGGFYGS